MVLAVTNKTQHPLHLLGLHESGGAQLLDKEASPRRCRRARARTVGRTPSRCRRR